MTKKNVCGVKELLQLFGESLSPAEVISSKIMADISTAITKERLHLGMNQEEFAKHIHASQSQVSRWEHGDYNFSIKKLSEIAADLGLDINFSFQKPNVSNIDTSGTATTTSCTVMPFPSKNESPYASVIEELEEM